MALGGVEVDGIRDSSGVQILKGMGNQWESSWIVRDIGNHTGFGEIIMDSGGGVRGGCLLEELPTCTSNRRAVDLRRARVLLLLAPDALQEPRLLLGLAEDLEGREPTSADDPTQRHPCMLRSEGPRAQICVAPLPPPSHRNHRRFSIPGPLDDGDGDFTFGCDACAKRFRFKGELQPNAVARFICSLAKSGRPLQ